ncbi:MAG: esterase/lipase family protein, partial [Burkholderiales bacterium]
MSPVTTTEPVIIIHGLWVHGLAMGWLARRIAQDGFAARTYSYPTMRLTLSENAERFARYCAGLAAPRVHIVAHSMGGLVALKMLQMNRQLR